jgi:hypothetical protein
VTGAGAGRPAVKVFNFDLFGNDKGVFPNVRDRLTPLNVATFDGAAPANEGGVTVATGDPYAAAGGFSNILVNPRAGGGQVQIFSLEQHHPVGQKDVATSGVSRPHDYEPGAPRMAMPARPLALGSHRAVDVGTLSTWTGAQVLVVPRAGGAVRLWQADDHGVLSPKSTLKAKGTGVSGI